MAQQDDLYAGYDNQENDFIVNAEQEINALTGMANGRPMTGARLGTALIGMPPGTKGGDDAARPLTSMRAAGYSSQARGKFDPLNQAATNLKTKSLLKKPDKTPEQECKELEKEIHRALEESANYSCNKEYSLALEQAKEAAKHESILFKLREQHFSADQINFDLSFSVGLNLGQQYHNNKLHSDAVNIYNKLLKNKQFSQSGLVRLNMGNTYFEQGKYPNAIKMYRMALDQVPTTSKIMKFKMLRNIGLSFIRMEQYQDAVRALDSVVENIPDHISAFNLLICIYALGDTERIQTAFLKLLEIQSKLDIQEDHDIPAEISIHDDGLRKELRKRRNNVHKSILVAARLVAPKINPHNEIEGYDWVVAKLTGHGYSKLANQMEMAKSLAHLSRKDFKSAISCLKSFEKKQEELKAGAATNLSFLYFLESDIKNAVKYAEMAIEVDRYNAQALVNSGNCSFVDGDFQRAKDMYAEAVNVEADCLEGLYNLGLALKKLGNLQEAFDVFRKLNSMIPESTDVMYQLGEILNEMGNDRQAIKYYEALNTAVPHDPGVLMQLGALHCKQEDDVKALHFYSESHRIYPANMDVISWLGAFYVKSEVYEKAVPYFELASNIQATEVKWKLMVASCYRRIGAFPLALRKYKEIHKEYPDNIECLRYLVHLCNEFGSKDEVLDYARKLKKVEQANRDSVPEHEDTLSQAKEASPSPSSTIKHTPSSPMNKAAADDDWGTDELGDDLLPM